MMRNFDADCVRYDTFRLTEGLAPAIERAGVDPGRCAPRARNRAIPQKKFTPLQDTSLYDTDLTSASGADFVRLTNSLFSAVT